MSLIIRVKKCLSFDMFSSYQDLFFSCVMGDMPRGISIMANI